MSNMTLNRVAAMAALSLLVPILLAACSDGDTDTDAGLSRAEVEEIVRTELADAPEPEPGLTSAEVEQIVRDAIAGIPQPEPGLTRGDIQEIVEAAIADIPEPETGLTRADVQRIARSAIASIPPRSAPAEYTKFFVDNAIARYESEGLDAILRYYNREESVDGQWYVFIVDQDDKVIGHYNAHLLGLDLKGPLGTDAEGYNFGREIFESSLSGNGLKEICKSLNDRGVTNRGKR